MYPKNTHINQSLQYRCKRYCLDLMTNFLTLFEHLVIFTVYIWLHETYHIQQAKQEMMTEVRATFSILSPGISPWSCAGEPWWTAVTKIPTSFPPVRRMPTLPSFLKLTKRGSGLHMSKSESESHKPCSSNISSRLGNHMSLLMKRILSIFL